MMICNTKGFFDSDIAEKEYRKLNMKYENLKAEKRLLLDKYSVKCSENKELKREITLRGRKIKSLKRGIERLTDEQKN